MRAFLDDYFNKAKGDREWEKIHINKYGGK